MKKTFYSDIHDIKAVDDPGSIYGIIREAGRSLTTYNQLMAYYEDGGRDIGVVFTTSKDNIMFLHLPLFCRHFGIELYALPNGSEDILSSIFGRKYVRLVCLYRDDASYRRFKQLGSRDVLASSRG